MNKVSALRWGRLLGGSLLILSIVFLFSNAAAVQVADPTSVTIAGSLQSELGCPGDWQPECTSTQLIETGNGVWRAVYTIPTGDWEYKMALNGAWDESYPSENKGLSVASETAVTFYFDNKTTAVVDSVNDAVAVAAGSFQDQLGCPGVWQPACVNTLLTDVDGDGVYSFSAGGLAAGNYEFKVALNEAWDISYPADNVPFTIDSTADVVTITWDSATTTVTVEVSAPPQIEWVVAGNFQDDLPASSACGEWNNACPETTMEDNNGDGVFRLVGENLPAASYEYKIVESGNWDNAHPANNVPFTADGSQMRWYFQPGPNNVADNANQCIATVVGNFQSQLGGSDWSPDNLRSMMWQESAGSDWYTFTATLPAGNWEYKVARNEDWTESYPPNNVALVLGAETAVAFRYNCVTNEVLHSTGGLEPGDEDLVRGSLRTDLANELFYFVMPDRFDDGDPGNNTGGDFSGGVLDHGYLPSDKGYYHGGDLAGLQGKLDYLESLGVTAIWMTPQFTNRWVQGDGTIAGSTAAYHGYWQIDYTQIDPHFGDNDDMLALIQDAHSRGMKIFFDIVINHTGDIVTYEEGVFTYRNKTDFPYKNADGVIFDDRDYAGTGAFPPLDPAVSFPYTPAFAAAEDATAKNPAWLNDPIYYHNRGDSTFTGENSLYGDFFGLDDLFTEHPDVVNGMIDIHKNMITEFDIDGFRVDTVKHVNDELWEAFVPAILDHAATQGNADFFIFGEIFSGDPAFTSRFTTELPFPSVLDFGFDGAASNFAARSEPTDQMRDFFTGDDYYTDDDSNAYGLVKFIGNHDIGRFGYVIDSSNPGAADAERVSRAELGVALSYFSRGIPLLYYGDEQGFTGDGGDKDARQDMMPSLVPSYNDDNLIGTNATTADANFDQTHTLYQTFSDLAQVRDANMALRQGVQIHRYSQNSAGIYAFSRIDPVERVEYLVVFNNSESADTAEFAVGTPGTSFTKIYDSDSSDLTINSNTVSVSMVGLSSAVYRADSGLPASTSAPGISMNTPAAGSEVNDRIEVGATVSSDAYAEVTFAVSVDGGEYMVVGTDDNAPYRVFYDVSSLPAGSELTFKAIVNEDGNLNADKVTVTVGEETPPPGGGSGAYAVIHYLRDDGDYGDHTIEPFDFNNYWGLHLWGDIDETIEWTAPKPFLGEDEYGRFAWVKLADNASEVGFIVHRGDTKDGTDDDRFFNPGVTPEIWLRQDDATTYTSQAEAQGYVTVRYHREDGDYGTPSPDFNTFWGLHLWGDAIADGVGTEWTSPRPFDGVDDYGAYWNVPIKAVDAPVNFIIHRGDAKDPGPDQSFIPFDNAAVWIQSGVEAIYPSRGAADNTVYLRYHRADGDYGDYTSENFNDFWGMHVWTGAANPNPAWQQPVKPIDFDIFGPIFNVPLVENAAELAYILHRGDTKDPGNDQILMLDKWGYEVWQLEGEGPNHPDDPHYVLPVLGAAGANPGNINQQSAYWVDEKTIAWAAATSPNLTYSLHYAPEGGLEATADGITGGGSIPLAPGSLSDVIKAKFPHLANLPGLTIDDADLALVPDILKGQIAISAVDAEGMSVDATGLQIPGVLDDLYTFNGDLGVSWSDGAPTIHVWAPTAKSVTFHLFDDSDPTTASTVMDMTLDPASGVWSIPGDSSWNGKYYLYEVEVYVHSTGQVENNLVTDPYSVSLAMNSTRSQIVDLDDATLKPAGWDATSKPELVAPEDISIYEIHVRDFSVNDDSVPEALKGTYKAFTLEDTNGVNHLQALQAAGLTHLHLLPVFDIATINENKAEWQEADWGDLATYDPDSDQQQALITQYEDLDGFNWGYDPFHYTTPEGSYSTNPDGSTRIVEFREMVQSLNEDTGLRVVMDVVYNHTNSAGQDEKSVLDRIVPGYYHRLNDKGQVETSTCCQNTASEHNMMEKLMIDSLVTWAKEYKVDAFRFDLMGHHMKRNMLNVRAALDGLTLENDGVDGSAIYLYGEGWNFGEVADNARGENATQLNMAGTGIGTFSDRLRDAVRGGGPFDGGDDLVRRQGFANGLYYDPNALNDGSQDELDTLLLLSDQIRVGMAGNLADYEFIDRNGNLVTGADVDYNGQPSGYTQDPQEDITYISKHDNQTLYDNNTYKIPLSVSIEDRVRVQNVGLSTVLLGQGVPFTHAGSDLLRSKSFDRDSFNSGDWFNKLDFTYQESNYGVGLPVAGKNQDNWTLMQPRLADPALNPDADSIMLSAALFQELLAIRESSPLFRLQSEAEVQERVLFHNTGPNQLPGLIVMSIDDAEDTAVDLDRHYENIYVVVNANDEAQSFMSGDAAGLNLALHLVQMDSADLLVQTSSFDSASGMFTVPGRTTAVFVLYESPVSLIDDLIDQIAELEDQGVLNKGQANALTKKLEQAKKQLDKDKPQQAINAVNAFINQINAFSGNVLPEETAAELIMEAEMVIAAIQAES